MFRRIGLVMLAIALAGAAQESPAASIRYFAALSGPNESPPVASPGTGLGTIDIDVVAHTLRVAINFTGLTSGTTASHIHTPTPSPFTGTAGVATTTPTFAGFPLGVTSGSFLNTLDLTQASSYNPAFVTANGGSISASETALAAGLAGGLAYLNIHTTTNPGGEIRGFLIPVPEPSSIVMLGIGAAAVIACGWRFRNRTQYQG